MNPSVIIWFKAAVTRIVTILRYIPELLHELSTGHGLGVPEEVPHQLRHFIMLSRGSKWLGYRNLAETNNLLGNNCNGSITSARTILHDAIAREDKTIFILRSLERYRKPMCEKRKKKENEKPCFCVHC